MTLNLNGTTGISGIDGSSSTPVLKGTDTDSGISFGSDIVTFNVGGSEKARLHSNGNFGIGRTDPDQKLVVRGSGTTILKVENSDDGTAQITLGNTGSSNSNFKQTSGDFLIGIGGSDRLKIFGGGGMDTFRQNNGNVFQYRRNTASLFVIDNLSNESNTRMRIRNPGGTISYNSSSDYRLKENDVKLTDGITRLKKLRPITFKWKSGTNTYDGFFAHEVSEACPMAVDGTKDQVATADDVTNGYATNIGDPIYQGIDHGKMVPLLTAALQEAVAKIEVLETKVVALEAG
jgi:hypothetical protein|tara:strand:+ start:97 stop:966 length:870 start_codon:yes stop_codon:yes gene_type:complete